MKDDIWTRAEVDSPCIKLCVVHPATRLCMGCARSIDEISRWSAMSVAERQAVMADLPERVVAAPVRRGGRAGRNAL